MKKAKNGKTKIVEEWEEKEEKNVQVILKEKPEKGKEEKMTD